MIIVDGMKMPSRCYDCPFNYDNRQCRATGKSFLERSEQEGGYVNLFDTIMPFCPLNEFPDSPRD